MAIEIKENKPIQLAFKVQFAAIRKPVNILVWCKNEYAITTMDNKTVLKRMVEVEKQHNTNIKLINRDGNYIAIQKYKGKTQEEIETKIREEIKKGSGGNFQEQ